jgi:dienelactone hydrolase
VAVVRPSGPGPFPAVLILHGTHGFADEYVELAEALAKEGILSFAACWFDGGAGAGQRFVSRIACDGGPRFVDGSGSDRFRLSRITIDTLVKALRARPDVRGLAAFGHSRGGGAALDYALSKPQALSALILNSTGYPDEIIDRGDQLLIPVLVMHGEADDPSDGGSAMTLVTRARRFEQALKRSGGAVESKYYADGHNSLFSDSTHYVDTVGRIADFVRRHVRN